ncbi:M50 family metallopeptidase [Catellatospora bangladeshensis]|uniref:Membrane protein n=1 Tax=Catellatospora bangladeshensis TaxID=310355 RepID=A0A8J3NLH4_9ACTN|nr:M50 family metallopeptidase [Catellatospora bangladeshensis]GIF83906.1 membrane protein [Catellatospora bangladeshensis]
MSFPLGDVLAAQEQPPAGVVAGAALIALALVMVHRVWRVVRNAITIAHEGGHAAAAVLTGRRLRGIRLHSDTSGLTIMKGRPTGLGMIITLLAGYLTPSLVGLGGVVLLDRGHIRLLLWICLLLLVAMLVMIRNFYGLLLVIATGAAVFAVSWYATAPWQALFAYTGVWFLLIGGVRPVVEVQLHRRRGSGMRSDPDQLAGITPLPGGFWVFVFLLSTAGSVLAAAVLLDLIPAGALPWS